MWDERYNSDDYMYGTQPNDFLVQMADQLPKGKVLCLADGEGRNGVWLASQGHSVTAVDASSVGLEKAQKLAKQQGVSLTTEHADLAQYDIKEGEWDAIISIFCHLPKPLQEKTHKACVKGLKKGGVFLLEGYTPAQLAFKTGGPPVVELMMEATSLKKQLEGLTFNHIKECERDIIEGELHHGKGAVVQVLATKP
ncbi:Methyltransferase type 11 [Candidatus Terasakiella magnetica]|uniref:Methyltransferase type 11 n=1 Tax=Candidatus Terasakiella magnetica TaxID=1867952 RepID=A0A1C3RFE0_9PROT|nr:class I SAM-dependent methyltransferase [Candidatus Terasakiella magnetica]SCA55979.1 Methyltransferase type 11 [Candidatus Terasakiella magnetica]